MTAEEKTKMMEEIMQVVDKHVAKSESSSNCIYGEINHRPKTQLNRYGREFGISDEEMAKWKEEYRSIRVDTKAVLEEVARNPIDVSLLNGCPSFDIERQTMLLK